MSLQSCFSNAEYCFHNLAVLDTKNVIISVEMTTICKLSRSGRSYSIEPLCTILPDKRLYQSRVAQTIFVSPNNFFAKHPFKISLLFQNSTQSTGVREIDRERCDVVFDL